MEELAALAMDDSDSDNGSAGGARGSAWRVDDALAMSLDDLDARRTPNTGFIESRGKAMRLHAMSGTIAEVTVGDDAQTVGSRHESGRLVMLRCAG